MKTDIFSALAFRLQVNGVSFRTPETQSFFQKRPPLWNLFLKKVGLLFWTKTKVFKYSDDIHHTVLVQRLPGMGSQFVRLSVFVSCGQASMHDLNWIRLEDKRRQILWIQKRPETLPKKLLPHVFFFNSFINRLICCKALP